MAKRKRKTSFKLDIYKKAKRKFDIRKTLDLLELKCNRRQVFDEDRVKTNKNSKIKS
jgi:hypothetical protein